MAGRINWSQSCFLGSEATASSYMAYAVPSTVRIMVALYRRASAIPPFRCTGIALSSWNSFCFSGTLFSNCLREVVLMVLLAIWRRAKVTSEAALSLPSQEFNVLTLQPPLPTLLPYITIELNVRVINADDKVCAFHLWRLSAFATVSNLLSTNSFVQQHFFSLLFSQIVIYNCHTLK